MYRILRNVVISDVIPQNPDVLWLRPVEKGFSLYYHDNGDWKVLRVMNDEGTSDPTDDKPYELYYDIYIGAAAQPTTIKTSTYHHDTVLRDKPISITASSQKIWLIFPNDAEVPTVLMSGMEVAKELYGTTTIDEATYKVYESLSYYTGTFNVCLI